MYVRTYVHTYVCMFGILTTFEQVEGITFYTSSRNKTGALFLLAINKKCIEGLPCTSALSLNAQNYGLRNYVLPCVRASAYVRPYVCTYLRTFVRMHVRAYVRKYVRMYVRMCVRTGLRKDVRTYVRT